MIEIWKLLGGISFFLIGVNYLEESIHQLAGRPFKLFIKKYTSSNIKSVFSGVLSSAILQSSSVVNMIALAFVGANIINIQHALALVIGSNFGTTLGSWIIAGIGFSLHIENIALSLSGLFGIGMMLANKESVFYQWNKLLFGFGFLFLGLSFITDGMNEFVNRVDLTNFQHLPSIVLFLLGFIFTAIIQSSTITIAILLAALHINAISLFVAMAILLGAEIGTTIKLIIASFNGSAEKKQLAYGNLFFNLLCAFPSLLFLSSMEHLITDVFKINSNIYGLVLFQSMINLFGILLIFPLIKYFTKHIVKFFTPNDSGLIYINKINPNKDAAALKALEDEIKDFLLESLYFTISILKTKNQNSIEALFKKAKQKKGFYEMYEHFKSIHGYCHEYAVNIEKSGQLNEKNDRLKQLVSSNRNIIYALKSIKDAYPDIRHLMNSSNDIKFTFYKETSERAVGYCSKMLLMLDKDYSFENFDELKKIYSTIIQDYTASLDKIYDENLSNYISELEISTLINFNRVIYAAFKSFLVALKDHLLPASEASYFDKVPGFIH